MIILDKKPEYLCKNCKKDILLNQQPFCKLCGKHIPYLEDLCGQCKNLLYQNYKFWYDEVISPFLYQTTIKKLIHIIKYNRNLPLAYYMGNIFAEFLINNNIIKNIDYIIPVPIHLNKLRDRGFNQSEIFAKVISKLTNIKMLPNLLHRNKFTSPQSGLTKKQRFKNVKNAFLALDKYNIKKSSILLIDDIFTTGSTVNECSKVLKQKNVNHILVATLSRG